MSHNGLGWLGVDLDGTDEIRMSDKVIARPPGTPRGPHVIDVTAYW